MTVALSAKMALQQGFLCNREDRKGRTARLCLGEPIPAGAGMGGSEPERSARHVVSLGGAAETQLDLVAAAFRAAQVSALRAALFTGPGDPRTLRRVDSTR